MILKSKKSIMNKHLYWNIIVKTYLIGEKRKSKRYPIKLNDYPHKPKRLLFNITKKSPPETQNKAFLSFPVGSFYCQKGEKWLFYAKKRITEIVSFQLSLFGRGRRTRTLGTRFWRPLLYQLSYTPKRNGGPSGTRTPDRPVMSRLL